MKILIICLLFIVIAYIGVVLGLLIQWENNKYFYKYKDLKALIFIIPFIDIYILKITIVDSKCFTYIKVPYKKRLLKIMYAYCNCEDCNIEFAKNYRAKKRSVTIKQIIEYLGAPESKVIVKTDNIVVTEYRKSCKIL